MKKSLRLLSVFSAAAMMSLASCGPSAEEKAAMEEFKQEARKEQAAKTENTHTAAVAPESADSKAAREKVEQQAAMNSEREFLGYKAAYYLQAKADSLESNETMGNGKYDLGAGFPKALRDFEKAFAKDTAYQFVGGFELDREYDGIKVISKVIIRDKTGGQTFFSGGKIDK